MKNNELFSALWLNDPSGRIIFRPIEEEEKVEEKKAKLIKWTR